jgi:DNA-binding XRE family transcriptional regulator
MKAGQLFEAALKHADLDLEAGAEYLVRVTGKGKQLRLVLAPPEPTEFETTILARSKNASSSKAHYEPKLFVGETIRALRKTAGLTLESLAAKSEMSKGSLCSIEKGERSAGLSVLRKIAKALQIPVGMLAR